MASGRKWCGRPTVPSKVLYCLGEGKANLIKRINAWAEYHRLTPEERSRLNSNFRVDFEMPQLASKQSVDSMLYKLQQENYTPDVVVVDTFARSFVGLDENSQKDTGLWVEQADRLRKLGFTVLFIHHTAKNTEFGLKYRGSTAIMGAMDSAFTLQKDRDMKTISKLECTKQKDHDEGEPLYFERLIVKTHDKDRGSIVLVPTSKPDVEPMPEHTNIDLLLSNILQDNNYMSDRARARDLSKKTGLTESAAQARIVRKRRDVLPDVRITEHIENTNDFS